MGGDNGPSVVVPGVALAQKRLAERNPRFLLHGDPDAIQAELDKHQVVCPACEVRPAQSVIPMDAKPAKALRGGRGSSLWNAVQAVKDGEARAAVSAGNTGALMAISRWQLKMIEGLERPAIVASWPTSKGVTTVLDVGANVESDGTELVEFAIMGEAFYRAVHGRHLKPGERPKVGFLNVGAEEEKGHQEVKEAQRLLRESNLGLNYYGFVEGNDIGKGTVEVVATDGFTGNVALKTAEGTARFFAGELRGALTSSLGGKIGALIARGALGRLRERLDPSSVNGGPLLGLRGVVVKAHGGSDPKGFANAIRIAADLADSDFLAEIERNTARLLSTVQARDTLAESA